MTEFSLPDWYEFPPSFTLQPVQQTQQRQLAMWCSLVLRWAAHHRTWTLVPTKWPLFANERIGRRMPHEGVDAVVRALLESGHAEWADEERAQLRLMAQLPSELGTQLYHKVRETGMIGSVYTVLELCEGDESETLGFSGTDPALFRKALQWLEDQNKAKIFKGAESDADGVKFFDLGS